jgi:hypothetical protein
MGEILQEYWEVDECGCAPTDLLSDQERTRHILRGPLAQTAANHPAERKVSPLLCRAIQRFGSATSDNPVAAALLTCLKSDAPKRVCRANGMNLQTE